MNNHKGTTLIEVLVASLVFSIGVLGGAAFFSLGQAPEIRAQETNLAMQLAVKDMETAIALGANGAASGSDSFNDPSGTVYTHAITVAAAGPNSKSVTCIVTWNSTSSGSSVAQSRCFVTYVSVLYPRP